MASPIGNYGQANALADRYAGREAKMAAAKRLINTSLAAARKAANSAITETAVNNGPNIAPQDNDLTRKNITINVKTAIHSAQTYQELLPVTRELCAGLSSWGYQHATVTAQSSIYQGAIAIGAIAEKALKIRQRMEQNVIKFTPEEKDNVILLSREISRLYGEDTVNCERADRITNLCRLVMSLIFWVNHQSKWNNNKNGLSYKEQLRQPLSISLKTAVNKAQNFQELLSVANELHAGLSWWGYQYAHVPTSTSIDKDVIYKGRIATGAIVKKALKIKQERGFIAKNSIIPFCKKIYCLYVEDKSLCNKANWLTAIFRSVVRVISWADHQGRWGVIWLPNNNVKSYVKTYSEILCDGRTEGMEEEGEGKWSESFIRKVRDWKDQGATYIEYPNGT